VGNGPEPRLPVGGVILAAGLGRRMGVPKLLLPWQGRPLVRHVAEAALASQLDGLLVVTGYRADDVASALEGLPLQIVANSDYEAGLSTSLHAGIRALAGHYSAAMIMLGDQPLLTTEIVDRLLQAYWATQAPLVAPVAGQRRGNPVLFARGLFPELLTIRGDEGARAIINAHRTELHTVPVDESVFFDVDTPEAYAGLIAASIGFDSGREAGRLPHSVPLAGSGIK
jgi:molybdenum cofactor cytidylyltransferase